MSQTNKDALLDTLKGVVEPSLGRDVVSLGLVRNVSTCDGVAQVIYELPRHVATDAIQKSLRQQTEARLSTQSGVQKVNVEIRVTADQGAAGLPGVKRVVAVGAGKGGVGKSTVATLLAVGLKRRGLAVGLLDADVYGPSLPKITGTENAQPMGDEQGRIIPPQRDGIPIMSMGYLVDPDQAIIWRGPMAQKYVKEFIDRGFWGELDYLIVDLPPGTGDIPLTLAQSIPLTGAVVVCTPQDVALLDAVKALRMYQKLNVEPLGIVENMSYHLCPQCGHREDIFGHGGCEKAAAQLGVPFLGEIPLNVAIRRNGDAGDMFANFTNVDREVHDAIDGFVNRVHEEINGREQSRKPLPQLRISG
ncbi:MAG: Mrp/NBP35 family ATP-binding protein [Phycisphaerales bacterium]|nr:Mrp/NBP35 family ATP-binding protein [Phycisphaerales bacterium]